MGDMQAKAQAHFNAYRAALERRAWESALQEFFQAVKLDAKQFAPFPVGKYHPQRILGAGGFGVAFLCKHRYMDAQVVVKALALDQTDRNADKVFSEAQLLRQLDHPAIIRVTDCGYVDSEKRSRPFLVMDYFEGLTLEEHVRKHGPLALEDFLGVAQQIADGLSVAHGKGILHRDVKPANILVRKDGPGWQVKLIDFGLAMRQSVQICTVSSAGQDQTLVGSSVPGTLDYGAPEQLGRLPGISIGPYSDVYGFGKTSCYALFKNTQPLPKHWQAVPGPLTKLLEHCLGETPKERPASVGKVLEQLYSLSGQLQGGRPCLEGQSNELVDARLSLPEAEKPMVQHEPSSSSRRRWQYLCFGLLAAVAVFVVVFGVLIATPQKRNEPSSANNPPREKKGIRELVVGQFLVKMVDSPNDKGVLWEFFNDQRAVAGGAENGTWRVEGERLVIDHYNKTYGITVLRFEDDDTLTGANQHQDGKLYKWMVKRVPAVPIEKKE